MSIYKNPIDNFDSLLQANVYIGEVLITESPRVNIKYGHDLVVFQFMINSSQPSKHGLRLKAKSINGKRVEISIDINSETGYPTLDKNKTDTDINIEVCRNIAILAGAFSIYALDALKKAYGYFNNGRYITGDEKSAVQVIELAQKFNSLSKSERNKYLKISKSNLKVR